MRTKVMNVTRIPAGAGLSRRVHPAAGTRNDGSEKNHNYAIATVDGKMFGRCGLLGFARSLNYLNYSTPSLLRPPGLPKRDCATNMLLTSSRLAGVLWGRADGKQAED